MASGVRVWLKEPKPEEGYAFSFPRADATLEPETVNELKMRPALVRFARRLAKQLQKKQPDLIGIDIDSIGFTCLYRR